jgi:hypothetical protein
VKCSEHLKDFLCALYVPKCDPADIGKGLVLPSQELCHMSRDGCEPLTNKFGFYWPQQIWCERFPDKPIRFNKLPSFNHSRATG